MRPRRLGPWWVPPLVVLFFLSMLGPGFRAIAVQVLVTAFLFVAFRALLVPRRRRVR